MLFTEEEKNLFPGGTRNYFGVSLLPRNAREQFGTIASEFIIITNNLKLQNALNKYSNDIQLAKSDKKAIIIAKY